MFSSHWTQAVKRRQSLSPFHGVGLCATEVPRLKRGAICCSLFEAEEPLGRRGQLSQKNRFRRLQTKTGFRTVRGETCFGVKWTILDPNTLRKTGANALSADRAANALQILGEFPGLAAVVETWRITHSDLTCPNSLPEIGRSGQKKNR